MKNKENTVCDAYAGKTIIIALCNTLIDNNAN